MPSNSSRGFRVALAVGVLLAVAACKKPEGMPQGGPAAVGVIVAQPQPVTLTADLTGRTSAYLVAEVRPQVSGVIRKRLFEEGAYVRAGQSLYQIDPATYQATFQSAQAGLAQAQAAETSARLRAQRYKELVAINAVSKQENDDAQAAWRQAQANVGVQRAGVTQARIGLDYSRIASPISGRIGKSSVTPGALVTASQAAPLATVQNLDKIYVDLTQSAGEMMKLRRDLAMGQLDKPASAAVTLTLDDGTVYPTTGRLEFSDISVDPGTGSVNLRAVFDNPNGVLLPGLFVRAKVSKGVASSGILVPQAAVTRDAKGDAIAMVVGAGNKAEARVLTVSQTVGQNWLVTGGLKAGDRVIVDNLQAVQPGAPVKPTPVAAKR